MRRHLGFIIACVALWTSAACSSRAPQSSADGGRDLGGGTDVLTGPDGAAAVPSPDSSAGRALDWVLAALNGAPVTEAQLTGRFSATLLARITPSQLLEALAPAVASGPWVLVRIESSSGGNVLTGVVTRADGQYWRIFIATEASARIGGLLIQPAGDLDPNLKSWDTIDQAANTLAPRVNLLAATIDGGVCTPLHALAPTASLAIGSTFKLWVLAALAEDIRLGNHVLTDTIPIEDAKKSLPSGILQDQPAGTALPLAEYAKQMISISDNTATDHLLWFLGREAVEETLARTGHHDPMQNQPFLSTREMFILKLMLPPAERQTYIEAPITQRRVLLQQYAGAHDPRSYAGPPWTTPLAIEDLEWFASTSDLCNVMRDLKEYGDQPATQQVYDVLALNPGAPDHSGAFSYVGFKGGSEPGVLNLTWLLRRQADDAWLFVTLGVNDSANPVDEASALYVAQAARGLLVSP